MDFRSSHLVLATLLALCTFTSALQPNRKMLSTPLEFDNDLVLPRTIITTDDGDLITQTLNKAKEQSSVAKSIFDAHQPKPLPERPVQEPSKSLYSLILARFPGIVHAASANKEPLLEAVSRTDADPVPSAQPVSSASWAAYDLLPETTKTEAKVLDD